MPLFFGGGGGLCWLTDWCLNHKDTPANKHSVVNGSCCWFLEIYKKIVIKSQKKSCKGTCIVNSQAKKYQQPFPLKPLTVSHATKPGSTKLQVVGHSSSDWPHHESESPCVKFEPVGCQPTDIFRIFCHLPKMVYSNHLQKTPFVCFEWLPRSGRSNVVSSGCFSFWFGDLEVKLY